MGKLAVAFATLIVLSAAVFVSGCVQQPSGTTTTTTTGAPSTTSTTAAPTTTTTQSATTTSTSGLPSSASVAIQNFAFSPQTVHVAVGGVVTWTNMEGTTHTVVSNSGSEMGSGNLGNGQAYSHAFPAAGTYAYHCGLHPSMTGMVIVGS